ncbi:hypothetical protein ACIA5G_39085 [Amycolatopsis sp. NPDC051758]|uniref:hypothetical protein n=1 Tax=Amycolatopsis sp. NPDC051758 TaxID=3363935 RepID=UPI0037B5B19F
MTQHADRKARIRAYQAAHPDVPFTAAARHVDAADITARLAALPPGPQNALAALLATLPHNDEALTVAACLAARLTPDPEAERLARLTTAAEEARRNPPAGLSASRRRALEQAFRAAQDDEDWYLMGSDSDYPDPYIPERRALHAVATALRCAVAVSDGGRFAGAAADVLDSLMLDFTADALRGRRYALGTIPATAAAGPAARDAHAALHALAAAADIPWRGDEEWTACIQLLEQARDLVRAASARGWPRADVPE